MTSETPVGYTRLQIVLHWAVVILVVVQFLLGPTMTVATKALLAGEAAPANPLAWAHILVGSLILIFAAWRVGLRFANGTPATTFEPKTAEQEFLVFLTRELSFFLYLTIFVIPVMGLVGWFYQNSIAATVHANMKILLIAVVSAHVAIVLFQQFGLRDDAFQRMRKPRQD